MAPDERWPLMDEKDDTTTSGDYRQARNVTNTTAGRSKDITVVSYCWEKTFLRLLFTTFIGVVAYRVYTSFLGAAPHPSTFQDADEPQIPIVDETHPISNYTCIPGQPCWPSSKEWSAFNQSISGHLQITIPWAAPCYAGTAKDECKDVADDYRDGVERTKQYGSMEFLDWETCGQANCFLNSFAPSSPVAGECSLGRLSTYFVEAHSATDISKTLDFVREHNIRVSIKNTGHDYFGRSNAANSLAIWTHNMKDAHYYEEFQPKGCKTRYENVGEVGAGIQAFEAWEFFEPLGMLVTVGAVSSVGIAGGFGQGGGHGPLGPTWGLMVDNAIEFDVVTADGQLRTINECTDPDLFWAMRGGGGGTYAVLVSYKFQLHPAVPLNVYSFQAHFPMPEGELDITKSQAHKDVVRALAQNQSLFSSHGIAGYNFILPDHMVALLIVPTTDTEKLASVTSKLHDFLSSYPGLNITDNSYHTFQKFSEWHKFTEAPEIARNGPVGLGLSESGRFLPKKLFETAENIENVVNAVVTAMQFSYSNNGGGSAQLYATGPANHADNSKTGVNPAWRDAMWEVIMGGGWTSNTPPNDRTRLQYTISASIQPFKALTPGGGCYLNEGDWMEDNWQQTFFGSNYNALLRIKKRYDPTGLFNCWKCVGWTGYDDPMYSCYAQSGNSPNPTIPLGPVG